MNFDDHHIRMARAAFPGFYALASPAEIDTMNRLVIAKSEFEAGITMGREGFTEKQRAHLERSTDECERVYTRLREELRHSVTFNGLPERERAWIENALFHVEIPDDGR
jgi:hypothetical protein